MNFTIRNTTADKKKQHHKHGFGINAKKDKLIIKKISKLFEKKNTEINIVSNPGRCYQAMLKEHVNLQSKKTPLCLFKIVLKLGKKGSYFLIYSLEKGWLETENATIHSLVLGIKHLEGIKV